MKREDPTGRFVVEKDLSRGFGWCVSVADGIATVRYVDLPDAATEISRTPVESLLIRDLPQEMRVWVRNRGFGWWPGRIKGREPSGNYFVQLAGRGPAIRVPPWSIQVRWDEPLGSATEALSIGMTDTTDYYDARIAVVENMLRQRAASRGFTAVLSASIAPFHHQIDVLTRVLNDPVMRYVLADEVGLGKTIEAGLIIRQLFLDRAVSNVVIATPSSLSGQWHDELVERLKLRDQMRRGALRIIEHAELTAPTARVPDLLVVDEAHRLVGDEMTSMPDQLVNLAGQVRSLLLLTATPLRGHASTFLRLLHLIDPSAYDLRDIAEFESRLDLRHQQASSIELLVPNMPSAILTGVLDEFRNAYTEDDRLQELIGEAVSQLGTPAGSRSISAVADHMRETYRISRRVIRHRRSAAASHGFPVSGRRLETLHVSERGREEIDSFLEDWRLLLRASGDEGKFLFAKGVEAALAGRLSLVHWVDGRLSQGVDRSEEVLLRQARAAAVVEDARSSPFAKVMEVLRGGHQTGSKSVVFTGFPEVARKFSLYVAAQLGRSAVAQHLAEMTSDEQDSAVRRFLKEDECTVLVCDPSGEEGRNLQIAERLIHLDLPLSVNRLEQRIGRADRYNASAPLRGVPSQVIVDEGSRWIVGHVRLLSKGVGVFEHSVATLQRVLAQLEQELLDKLWTAGVSGFDFDIDELRQRLDDERNQIDLLEELEGTLMQEEFTPLDFDNLLSFEEDSAATEEAFDQLTSSAGGIQLRKTPRPYTPELFSYSVSQKLKTIPLMPEHHQDGLIRLLPAWRTFSRDVALKHPESELVRLGNPLVEWINKYLRVDEGGRARALWRRVEGWPRPEVWFCFDYLLEFEDAALQAENAGVRRRLRRRGDAFLPPRIERIWTDGQTEARPEVRERVLEPSEDVDIEDKALRGPRWETALHHFPDWSVMCQAAERQGRELIAERNEVRDWISHAEAAAGSEMERRTNILGLWAHRITTSNLKERALNDLASERALSRQVLEGIRQPRFAVQAVGAIVVAGDALEH